MSRYKEQRAGFHSTADNNKDGASISIREQTLVKISMPRTRFSMGSQKPSRYLASGLVGQNGGGLSSSPQG